MFLGIIAVIIFLSLLILIHELGHFLAAKKFGLWIEEFGFGLPPRAWAKKIGETIYSLNWLPFGGFVKIFGEEPSEKNQAETNPKISEPKIVEKELSYRLNGLFFRIHKEHGRYYREKQYGDILEEHLRKEAIIYKREAPVSLGDRYSNFIDFIIEDKILIEIKSKPSLIKSDYFQIRRYLEATGLELGLMVNFREKIVNPKRILNPGVEEESFRILSDISDNRSFSDLSIWKRAVIVISGVLMNFLLGWFLVSIVFSVGIPQAILITEVFPGSPAAKAGIEAGDKITAVSVRDSTSQILKLIREEVESPKIESLDANSFIKFIDVNRGQQIILRVERGGEIKEFELIPRLNPPADQGALGIGLIETGLPKQNVFSSLWEGLKVSLEIIRATFAALFNLVAWKNVTGPVGIVKITAEAGSMGFIYLLQLLSLISLNLSVINLLPFPALDGGRLVFLLVEKLKGSPLPLKFEKYANAVGMAFLLLLMLIITIKDVLSL